MDLHTIHLGKITGWGGHVTETNQPIKKKKRNKVKRKKITYLPLSKKKKNPVGFPRVSENSVREASTCSFKDRFSLPRPEHGVFL